MRKVKSASIYNTCSHSDVILFRTDRVFSSTHINGLPLASAHREVSISTEWRLYTQRPVLFSTMRRVDATGRRRLASTEIDLCLNLPALQPRRVLARASKHAMFERRPRTYIIDQCMVEPVANSISNLNQFFPIVRNHSKKNDQTISSRARLNVAAITVQLLSHIQMEFQLFEI